MRAHRQPHFPCSRLLPLIMLLLLLRSSSSFLLSPSSSRSRCALYSYSYSSSTSIKSISSPTPPPSPPPYIPELRVDRILSNRGYGTRKQVQDLIRRKRVYTLSPHTATATATTTALTPILSSATKLKINTVFYDKNNTQIAHNLPLLLAFNKPREVLTAVGEDAKMGRKTVSDFFPALVEMEGNGKGVVKFNEAAFHPVGRLDYDTSGLLLFSSDGQLTQRLLHPKHNIEKTYIAEVEGVVNQTELIDKLKSGVTTGEGVHTAKVLYISKIDEILTRIALSVEEGKHRMVRRMLFNCGHPVINLKRTKLGVIELGEDLEEGKFRILNEGDNSWAGELLKTKGVD